MNVFVLSNDDVTSNIIFSRLFGATEFRIAGLALTETLLNRKNGGILRQSFGLLKKTDFRYWLYQSYINGVFLARERFLSCTDADDPCVPSLRSLCARDSIPVYRTANVNSPGFLEILERAKPDLIVIRINQILSRELLDIPRHGVWCVHSSLLPAYQGIAAEFHGLRLGERVLGTTVFRVTPELDKGEPLFQRAIEVVPGQTLFAHTLRNNRGAAGLLRDAVSTLARDRHMEKALYSNPPVPSYHSWPAPGQVRHLHSTGHPLMGTWETLRYLHDALRGCAPIRARA